MATATVGRKEKNNQNLLPRRSLKLQAKEDYHTARKKEKVAPTKSRYCAAALSQGACLKTNGTRIFDPCEEGAADADVK